MATHVARREGLPEPIPVTERFPGLPEADEHQWQELVIEHLHLKDWLQIDRSTDVDLLGAAARSSLLERGELWPPTLHAKAKLLEGLGRGTLLTGEGGDEVFGPRRITPLLYMSLRANGPRRRDVWLSTGRALAPRVLRNAEARAASRKGSTREWLRSDIRSRHARLAAADIASEPLRWDQSVLWLAGGRAAVEGRHNYQVLGQEFSLDVIDPLLDTAFLGALAGFGGRFGLRSRTAWMNCLFADVLPAAVLSRSSKARFNTAYFGPQSREFARSWDRGGVDSELVDTDRLRQEWLADRPAAMSASLLHAAWLMAQNAGLS